jgi:ABC-type dipeptide/oligopeptide/nickel transport system permease subunit
VDAKTFPSGTLVGSPGARRRPAAWLRLLHHRAGVISLFVLAVFVALSLVGGLVQRYGPNDIDIAGILRGPSWSHLFGTDDLGRDVLSRVIDGSKIAVTVALLSVGIGMVFGLAIGVFAGYVGGVVDIVLNRAQDILFAFPMLLLAIILVAVLGQSVVNASVAIGIAYVPRFVRMARSATLSINKSEYLDAARLAGVSEGTILFRHVFPNVLPSVIVLGALSMSTAQLAYASLSFLGLGVNPPQADWGSMLSNATSFVVIAPWLIVFPAIALVVFMLALNVLGDAIRDVLDPRGVVASAKNASRAV